MGSSVDKWYELISQKGIMIQDPSIHAKLIEIDDTEKKERKKSYKRRVLGSSIKNVNGRIVHGKNKTRHDDATKNNDERSSKAISNSEEPYKKRELGTGATVFGRFGKAKTKEYFFKKRRKR